MKPHVPPCVRTNVAVPIVIVATRDVPAVFSAARNVTTPGPVRFRRSVTTSHESDDAGVHVQFVPVFTVNVLVVVIGGNIRAFGVKSWVHGAGGAGGGVPGGGSGAGGVVGPCAGGRLGNVNEFDNALADDPANPIATTRAS